MAGKAHVQLVSCLQYADVFGLCSECRVVVLGRGGFQDEHP